MLAARKCYLSVPLSLLLKSFKFEILCQFGRVGNGSSKTGHSFFRCKRSIVIQSARLLNYHIQKAGREQTAEQAAAQQTEKEALARKEAGRAKAAATRKRKADEAEHAAKAAQEAAEAKKVRAAWGIKWKCHPGGEEPASWVGGYIQKGWILAGPHTTRPQSFRTFRFSESLNFTNSICSEWHWKFFTNNICLRHFGQLPVW